MDAGIKQTFNFSIRYEIDGQDDIFYRKKTTVKAFSLIDAKKKVRKEIIKKRINAVKIIIKDIILLNNMQNMIFFCG